MLPPLPPQTCYIVCLPQDNPQVYMWYIQSHCHCNHAPILPPPPPPPIAKVDFGRLVAQTEAVRRQTAVRDARRAAIAQQRLSEVHTEMAGKI